MKKPKLQTWQWATLIGYLAVLNIIIATLLVLIWQDPSLFGLNRQPDGSPVALAKVEPAAPVRWTDSATPAVMSGSFEVAPAATALPPTVTPTTRPTPTASNTPTPRPPASTPTANATAGDSLAVDSAAGATATLRPTPTDTRTATPTLPPTRTATATATHIPTATPSPRPSATPTLPPTRTATATASPTPATAVDEPAPKNVHQTEDLQFSPLPDGGLALGWPPAVGQPDEPYRIYSDMGTGYGVYIYQGSTRATTFVDALLQPETAYAYKVEAGTGRTLAAGSTVSLPAHTPQAEVASSPANQAETLPSNVTVIPAPTALPVNAVLLGLMSDAGYVDEVNTFNIVGEVRNDSNLDVGNVSVGVNFYDASGASVSEVRGETMVRSLSPGRRAPFRISVPYQANMTNYSVRAVGQSVPRKLSPQIALVSTKAYEDNIGFYHVSGVIKNMGAVQVSRVKVIATLYGRGGAIVNADFAYPAPATLNPGEQADFDVAFTYFPNVIDRDIIIIAD